MKTLNKICWILAFVLGLGSLVLFFTSFASISVGDSTIEPVGAVLAFGGKVDVAGSEISLAKSADILFCFLLTFIGFVLSIFSIKSKKLRYTVPFIGIISAVYMLVIALSNPWKFVDVRPLNVDYVVSEVAYLPFVLITAIALFAFTIVATAYLFIDDYIEVKESKGEKLVIAKRVIRFLRDYKSEVKKIVWPSLRDVLKNTAIVLIMCLVIGALIWLVDLGLGKFLHFILGIDA